MLISSKGRYALRLMIYIAALGDVEGSTAPVACDGIDNSCTRSDLCSTVKFWRGLDDVIEKYVDGVTLADLAAVPEINFDIKL